MTHTDEPAPSQPVPAARAFPNARTLWRISGIPVRADGSVLLLAGLVGYFFFSRNRGLLETAGTLGVAAAAAAATVLFLASILVHELGHALLSVRRGVPVSGITMFAMGGVTESTREPASAGDEFAIVGIGPLLSLLLGGLFAAAAVALGERSPLAAVAGYLGWINVALAVFNVIPGYPLDGGRLLRSLLWAVGGRRHRATRWAARVGQAFAGLLLAAGVWLFLAAGGNGFNGLWEVLLGLFLLRGASDSHRRAAVRERLSRHTAGEVMGAVPPLLAAAATLTEAVAQVQQRPSLLWPVGEPLAGGVTLDEFDAVPASAWIDTSVGSVARPPSVVAVEAATPMDEALDRLAEAPQRMLLVVDGGTAVGLLTPTLVADLTG